MTLGPVSKTLHIPNYIDIVDGTDESDVSDEWIDTTGLHHLSIHIESTETSTDALSFAFHLYGKNTESGAVRGALIDTLTIVARSAPTQEVEIVANYPTLPRWVRVVAASGNPSSFTGEVHVHLFGWTD